MCHENWQSSIWIETWNHLHEYYNDIPLLGFSYTILAQTLLCFLFPQEGYCRTRLHSTCHAMYLLTLLYQTALLSCFSYSWNIIASSVLHDHASRIHRIVIAWTDYVLLLCFYYLQERYCTKRLHSPDNLLVRTATLLHQ